MGNTRLKMVGGATTSSSSTLDRPNLSRLTRRSHSQRSSDPGDLSHVSPLPSNPLDVMEQGYMADDHHNSRHAQEKGSEKISYRRSAITFIRTSWASFVSCSKWAVRILLGQNPAWNSAIMVLATYLGILVAISSIFGWPVLPLIRIRGRQGSSVIPFGGGSLSRARPCHTTTINNYSPTTINNYV
ncbi:hypothetical protein QC764_301960 [Podospora pseudoanserina]|uniref:Uncharacterized protein n=1 Tax=Podospora pseudoanserina TaxID=2609844 RepID=A0ABR0ID81_9PEZI|nr:hypothetical protein QC764_301960 [Podospora pseudoanserina]